MGSSGGRDQDVQVIVEAEMLDSLSGIVQASGVRGGIGNPVSGSREAVTIDNIAPLIDGWTEATAKAYQLIFAQ